MPDVIDPPGWRRDDEQPEAHDRRTSDLPDPSARTVASGIVPNPRRT